MTIRNREWFRVVATVVGIAAAVLITYPIVRVLFRVVWTDGHLDLSALGDAFEQPGVWQAVLNTLILGVASTVVALVIGSGLAWILERTDARMGQLGRAMPLLPFLLPPAAGAVGWVLAGSDRSGLVNAALRELFGWFGWHMTTGPINIYSWPGLVFVTALYCVPFTYLTASAGLQSMDTSLEEQARVNGSGPLRTFVRITVPAMKPSAGAGALLALWVAISMFSVPAIIGGQADIDVLSVRIIRLLTRTYPAETGAALGLSGLVLITLGSVWAFQQRMASSKRHASISGKSARHDLLRLGRWRWLARGVVLGYLVVAVVIPFSCLAIVALNGFWTTKIKWSNMDLDMFREVVNNEITRQAVSNSIQLGIVGGLVAVLVAAMIVVRARRAASPAVRWIAAAIKLPAAVSSIIVGVGIILAYSGSPLSLQGTSTILFIGYLALCLPQASVAVEAGYSQIGSELVEAGQVSGAREGRVVVRLLLPLMLPMLVAAWAMAFARIVEDLTIASLLSGANNPVVGLRILDTFNSGTYAQVAALAIVLTAISSVVVVGMLALSSRFQRRRQ
jgi:iron(III) transport system permease protein